MVSIGKTEAFEKWIRKLRDERARSRINIRLRRLSLGILGDARNMGGNLWELRIDYGPGYRVYYTRTGKKSLVLLCGGDKRSQKRDVEMARELAHKVAGRRQNDGEK
ncbi:MAG: type II toxin-antitoxin system RelE/ParE family toxin [Gammaproteobacteria bacterium]|nr:type II toxin-antitoxin system RelE/ParE family toxin [Gammaproteobacteria bacterium]